MPSLDDIAQSQTALGAPDVAWLHALVVDWQIIADLSFSDLVLWIPDSEAKGMWAAAQIRPTTGPTTLLEDVAGTFLPTRGDHPLDVALSTGHRVPEHLEQQRDGTRVMVEMIPVRRGTRVVGVVARRTGEAGTRSTSALEKAYVETSAELAEMIRRGEFPTPGARSDLAHSLRVGDGFVRTDVRGVVSYASPNAMSAYRRLGLTADLVGASLGEVTTRLVDRRPTDRGPRSVLGGADPTEAEIENGSASLLVRTIPLRAAGQRSGSLILLRDVTELRLRERELVSKDATIREIHHRVKNNLQTVAALLRLQGRRTDNPEARAALEEAVRRVGSIALVHETLSQSFSDVVAFDEIADRLLHTVLDVSSGPGGAAVVRPERFGSFGLLPGEIATPLSMVLTELFQNASQHAYDDAGGTLTLAVNRIRDKVRLRVSDDGLGLPDDFDAARSLGLSIVTTLVEGELHGSLAFEQRVGGGTTVSISFTV